LEEHSLVGRAAVVTGSSRGIGRAIARSLASAGASVVINGRTAGAVDEVVRELRESGCVALGCVGSIADYDDAGGLIDECRNAFGGIDVLVNCAGIEEPPGTSILDIAPEAFRELIDVHLTGTFNTCRHAAPLMVERGGGSIVNTSSHSYLGHYGGTGYAAGKGGVNSLTFAIASELREHGVAVNAVCPGARTRLSSGAAYEARIRELHARGIMSDGQRDASLSPGPPELVGPFYAVLAGVEDARITGKLFTATGGYVGLHGSGGQETLLAYRDAGDGPWPVADLARRIDQTLSES